MTDYFWVLKRCILLTLTFSNLPFFATRRRCWGKCESIYIDNCTRRVRSLKTDTLVLHVRSKYRMNGTVAPICSCSCLLGNRDPATLWNVGNYLPTNKLAHPKIILLTPWCRVLPEKLTGLQLVKKFPAFHGTRRFITALTSVRHLSQSWASPIQSIYSHPTSWRSILMLSTHLRLGLPGDLLPSGFPSSRAAYRNSINWIQSHLVGQLLKLIHDARTHEYKKLPLSLSVRIWGGCWFSSQYGI